MRIDHAGIPVPADTPPPRDLLRMCPGCGAPTWPDISPSGEIRARHCIPCQIAIDRQNGHDL